MIPMKSPGFIALGSLVVLLAGAQSCGNNPGAQSPGTSSLQQSASLTSGATADTTLRQDTTHTLRVAVRLEDGSKVLGSITMDSLSLHTQYAVLALPFKLIREIDLSSRDGIATISLASGERLRGTLAPKSIAVKSMLGTLDLPFEHVVSMTVSRGFPAPDSGLVAFYPFDGDASDKSGHGFNGTVRGPTLCADRSGRSNKAYCFDGNDSYIAIPDGMIPRDAAAFTLSLWLSASDIAMNRMALYIGAAEGEASIQLKDAKVVLVVTLNGKVYSTRGELRPESWTHVAGVYRRGKTCQLWINGELAEETKIPDANLLHALPSHTSTIGCYAPAHLYHAHVYSLGSWKGGLDEIRIYDRALLPEEVTLLFSAER